LSAACSKRGLDADAILAEIARSPAAEVIERRTAPELIAHILDRYHAPLRPELERLQTMAAKVERVHGERASCPIGLADHLTQLRGELEEHLGKEERVLFPALLAGAGAAAHGPIRAIMLEHDDHGVALRNTRALTTDLSPPADACNTWRALYLGLEELERELMDHIHLENNVLFPMVMRA